MPLELVDPPKVATLNVMLYSGPGTGKTTGALSAPGPVLYLAAEGPNAAMFARRHSTDGHILEAPVRGQQTLHDAVHYLAENEVGTVVLDTVNAAFQTLLDEATKHGDPDAPAGKPTLPQFGDVTTLIERFCRHMRDLPVNFVIVAHEQAIKDEEAGGFERLPFTGTSNPALGVKLMGMVDVVGYCGRTPPKDGEGGTYVAQLFPGGGRRGKDRTGTLGENVALNLTDWLDTYTAALGPQKGKAK